MMNQKQIIALNGQPISANNRSSLPEKNGQLISANNRLSLPEKNGQPISANNRPSLPEKNGQPILEKSQQPIIEMRDVKIRLGGMWVHRDLNLSVRCGEVLGIVGGSGSGKTTLLREILMLQPPSSGSIKVFGYELMSASPKVLLAVQRRWGVLFQQNALFSSLNLLENTAFPLIEHTTLDKKTIKELAAIKIMMAGLPIDAAVKYPSELSGGMQKRAGIARAIVLDPELLFLDEPTAGLDPDSASGFDELILDLQAAMGLTILIVTHDLDTLWRVTDRVAFLGEGKVLCIDAMAELIKNPHPLIQKFFNGPRGRVAEGIYDQP